MGDYEIVIKEIRIGFGKKLISRSNKVTFDLIDTMSDDEDIIYSLTKSEAEELMNALNYSLKNWT